MTREPTDDELRRASSVVLTDDVRPGWGMSIAIPFPSAPGAVRKPFFATVNSKDEAAIERWRTRVAQLRPK